jgi:hypothetical protein
MYLKSVGQTFGPTIKYLAYLLLFHPDLEKMLGDLRRLKKVSQVTVPPMDLAMPGRLGCCTWWVTLKTQFLEVSSNGATPKWMVHNGTSENFPWMMIGGTPILGNLHLMSKCLPIVSSTLAGLSELWSILMVNNH